MMGVTTDCLEGAWFLAVSNVETLSEQLVDCNTVDFGSNGELMNNGFAFRRTERHVHEDRSQ